MKHYMIAGLLTLGLFSTTASFAQTTETKEAKKEHKHEKHAKKHAEKEMKKEEKKTN